MLVSEIGPETRRSLAFPYVTAVWGYNLLASIFVRVAFSIVSAGDNTGSTAWEVNGLNFWFREIQEKPAEVRATFRFSGVASWKLVVLYFIVASPPRSFNFKIAKQASETWRATLRRFGRLAVSATPRIGASASWGKTFLPSCLASSLSQ